MASGKNKNKQKARETPPSNFGETGAGNEESVTSSAADKSLSVGEWAEQKRPSYRNFPGPRMLDVPLRVTVDRTAYAELVAHAKETLETEICGVLAGEVCEDEEGLFVHVRNIVRGAAADQGSVHVTYTQETWNLIHSTMHERFPKLQIVGWYHSHPGYGVAFSEMDRFIQEHFFCGPTQIGMILDPLSGDVGLCVNADGIKYINRFWVDQREHRAYVPVERRADAQTDDRLGPDAQGRLESVEARLEQAVRALDELRTTIHRFLLYGGLLFGFGVILTIVNSIYSTFVRVPDPPVLRSYAQVPIKVGDKVLLLGVDVVGWQIPGEPARPQGDEGKKPPEGSSGPQPEPQGSPGAPPVPPASSGSPAPPQNANQGRN
jgi:proteasome lid subunit RPN8/RPN11